MRAVVFAGPTLSGDAILDDAAFRWLPPASEGDVYCIARSGPLAIGLIDGRFETVPAVWHKEILWALSRGIHVYGAGSMGALRAAELAQFGMVGVGSIFEDFRDGILRDDDEVAVVHAPAELGYRPLSEAMVDMRATLAGARDSDIVSRRTAEALLRIAKATFFKDRAWDSIIKLAAEDGVPKSQLARLARWLPAHRIERKRLDALAMVGAIRDFLATRPPPFRAKFTFQHTVYWQNLVARHRAKAKPVRG